MRTGNDKVSRPRLLAHAMALVLAGFAAGYGARGVVAGLAVRPPDVEPRDEFIVAPATEDMPAMAMWVAAELDSVPDATQPATQTLRYEIR